MISYGDRGLFLVCHPELVEGPLISVGSGGAEREVVRWECTVEIVASRLLRTTSAREKLEVLRQAQDDKK